VDSFGSDPGKLLQRVKRSSLSPNRVASSPADTTKEDAEGWVCRHLNTVTAPGRWSAGLKLTLQRFVRRSVGGPFEVTLNSDLDWTVVEMGCYLLYGHTSE